MAPRRHSSNGATFDDYFSYDYACFADPTFGDSRVFKGVRFADEVEFADRGDISEEELKLMWYSKDDYKWIKYANVTDLWNCTLARGLEGYHLDACDIKNEVQKRHISGILALQQDHRRAGIQDAHGLKVLSLAISNEASNGALQRAEKDAVDAFRTNRRSPYVKASTAKEYSRRTTRLRPLSKSRSTVN